MLPPRPARTLVALLASALSATACAASSPTPKALVDHPTPAEPAADDTAAPEDAPPPETVDIEPTAVPIEGSDLVEARASVAVAAPLESVRAAILKFEDYPAFMPEYSDAKRVGRTPAGNEKVYMEITTLGGMAKMFANVEVLPVRNDGKTEIHEAKFLDGNVRQFKAVWTLTPVEAGRTDMTLQVFLHPSIPLPDFLVNKANLDGAKKGALAMKRRIEGAK